MLLKSAHRLAPPPRKGAGRSRAARRDDGAGAQALGVRDVRRVRERLRLPEGEPAGPDAESCAGSRRRSPEQRPSASAATSDRRSAQPSSTATMAESRASWAVVMSGAFRGACACRRVGQLPVHTPIDFALFTRPMPAVNSGARRPLCVGAPPACGWGWAVKQRLKEISAALPPDIKAQVISDQSVFIKAAVDKIKTHLIEGSFFAAVIILDRK